MIDATAGAATPLAAVHCIVLGVQLLLPLLRRWSACTAAAAAAAGAARAVALPRDSVADLPAN